MDDKDQMKGKSDSTDTCSAASASASTQESTQQSGIPADSADPRSSKKRKQSSPSATAAESELLNIPSKIPKLNKSQESDELPEKFIPIQNKLDQQEVQSKKRKSNDLSLQVESPRNTSSSPVDGHSEPENNEPPSKMAKRSVQDEPKGTQQLSAESSLASRSEGPSSSRDVKRHIRRRTKFLLQVVLEQVEFYFSDSNLSKDRFMKQQLDQSEDGYMNLSVFGNFNKLQALHKDGVSCEILKKALKRSKVLQLSEDCTRVRRITPFKQISQEETDRRTIYVENLPSKATHAWIRTIFSQCGKVVYISLPIYRTTKEKKGFAFVEFETSDEAAKACLLNNPPPEKEQEKPGKFPKGNKTLNRLQKIVPAKPEPDSNEENVSEDEKPAVGNSATAEPVKKKKKKKGKKKKPKESVSEEKMDSDVVPPQTGETLEGKKKKKKKKKKRSSLSSLDGSTDQGKVDEAAKDSELTTVVENTSTEDFETKAGDAPETNKSQADEKEKSVDTKQMSAEIEKSADESKPEAEMSSGESCGRKKKKRKRKKKGEAGPENESIDEPSADSQATASSSAGPQLEANKLPSDTISLNVDNSNTQDGLLSRKERKRLRQEDIRRKKLAMEEKEQAPQANNGEGEGKERLSLSSQPTDSDMEDAGKVPLKKRDGSQLTSILKSKKKAVPKRVEFALVPETKEFVSVKEARKRKKSKNKEKLHLRIISKKEWESLRSEYIKRQKSHMTALKESLRELRQQEQESEGQSAGKAPRHVDLEDVFGTKRLKPSQDIKMAHVESLKFIPNVIVQWKCTHEMHRDKIRTMFKDLGGSNIAYVDAKEEAKSGYIRFKDEESAESFAKASRNSLGSFFSARLLPTEQQQAYWDKANEDRMKRLGRKKQEKGAERLARNVFNRNKATFLKKPNRIVFTEGNDDDYEIKTPSETKDKEESQPSLVARFEAQYAEPGASSQEKETSSS